MPVSMTENVFNVADLDPIANVLGEWSQHITWQSVLLRVVLSLLMAALIGGERSRKRHAAGFRTFILVCLASTIVMLLDLFMAEAFNFGFCVLSAASLIAIATVTVNSILFSSKSQIKGLTTSVALWACGVLGMTVGAGFYTISLLFFVALMGCLSFFHVFERYFKDRSNHFEVHLELTSASRLKDFVTTIRRLGLTIDDIESNHAYANSGLSVYSVAISVSSKELKKYKTHAEIIAALRSLDYVNYIEEMR